MKYLSKNYIVGSHISSDDIEKIFLKCKYSIAFSTFLEFLINLSIEFYNNRYFQI